MRLLVVLQLEEGETKPKMLKPKDIKKFKRAHPELDFVAEVTLYSNDYMEIKKDGKFIDAVSQNCSQDNIFD